jgi:hypothetical protein
MAGAYMFQAVQHPELATVGLVDTRDFRKKRTCYLRLVAQNNKADGVNVTPINVMLCVAKDETSVDIMCRRFCCNFLRISRL